MSKIPADVIQQIEQLNSDYICALDALDMPAWLACFNKHGQYAFIAEENYRRNFPIAFMLDDCYERLQDRVTQVVDIQPDSTEHYQTRHFTQLTSVTASDDARYQADFNFSVYYTRRDTNQTQILCVGRYIDLIDIGEVRASYIDKKAVTDTNVLPRYIAYPI